MGTLSVEQLDDNYDAWRDLAGRWLEPNAFLEPGFALQLARHAPARSRPRFVGVWREGVHLGEPRRLVRPVRAGAGGLRAGRRAGQALARQADRAGGALAQEEDRDCAEDVLARFLDWLAKSGPAAGVVFPRLVEDGPLHRALLAAARRSGRAAVMLERFERRDAGAGLGR